MPPKVEYSLTATAQQLIPFIEHLKQWGEDQMKKEKRSLISKKTKNRNNAEAAVQCRNVTK